MPPSQCVNSQLNPSDKPGRLGLFQEEPIDRPRQSEQRPARARETGIQKPAAQVVCVIPGKIPPPRKNQARQKSQYPDRKHQGQAVHQSVGGAAGAERAGTRKGR